MEDVKLKSSEGESVDSLKKTLNNMKPEDFLIGTTPDGIEQRCLDLCRAFIGGIWKKVSGIESLTVKRISGGFTNQLYHVKIKNSVEEEKGNLAEPTEVAIKLYEKKQFKNYHEDDHERLNDIVILAIASQIGISPKVYGIFSGGFIQQFVKHEQFRIKHQSNPAIVRDCAQLLAKIHSLDVPMRKDGGWFLRLIRNWFEYSYKHFNILQLVEKYNLEALKQKDLIEEFGELEKLIIGTNCPVVFSHADFRGGNILVTEPEQKLLTVDMEHCAYSPRALDIATYLSEWDKEMYDYNNQEMPSDEVIESFVRLYIEECDKLAPEYSAKAENSFQAVLRETKLFLLLNIMFWTGVYIRREDSGEPFPFNPLIKMTYVHNYFKMYNQTKQRLINDGTIEIDLKRKLTK